MLLSFGGRAMSIAAQSAVPDSPPILDTAVRAPRSSLLHYSPALVLVLIAIADAGRVTDPDLWGHVRFGQAVLAGHRLVLHDPYSYTAPGHLWRNHEWLTEIVMALVYNALGVVGLKLWKLACPTATIVLLSLGMAETGATPGIQLNTLLVGAVALMPQMEFRPQIFTFALFAAMLLLLAHHNYRGSAPLWLAIPIMALWGNLHGGFIMGLVALAVYTGVVALQDMIGGYGGARATRLAIITVAAALATLLKYEWGMPVTEKQVANGLMARREYIENPNLVQIREGFSLLDLKRYVEAHGFKGEGLGQLDFNDLVENAPIMVPVNALGYNHFVIFRGVMRDRVLLADPAWGNRTMTTDKFQLMWLDYGKEMGHIGFTVKRANGSAPISSLGPRSTDFVMFD